MIGYDGGEPTRPRLSESHESVIVSIVVGQTAIATKTPHDGKLGHLSFMSQVKIFGLREQLDPIKRQLSDVIHSCVVEVLQYPADKRAHRFFPLDRSDFFCPAGRSERYTILEFSMFEGRCVQTKKHLIRLLFERVESPCGIAAQDSEMPIFETHKHNWGFRWLTGDEHQLNYKVEVSTSVLVC